MLLLYAMSVFNDNHRIEFLLFSSVELFNVTSDPERRRAVLCGWTDTALPRETGSYLEISSWSSHGECGPAASVGPEGSEGPNVSLKTGRNCDPQLPLTNEVWDMWGMKSERNLPQTSNVARRPMSLNVPIELKRQPQKHTREPDAGFAWDPLSCWWTNRHQDEKSMASSGLLWSSSSSV